MWAIPTGTRSVLKKNQVKSPSPESRVPELGSDPPIGSDRDSGRDSVSLSTTLPFPSFPFFLLFPSLFPHPISWVKVGQVECPLTCHMSTSKWLFGLHHIHFSIYHGFSPTHMFPHVSHGSHYSSCLTHSTHDRWHLVSHSECAKCPAPLPVPRKT